MILFISYYKAHNPLSHTWYHGKPLPDTISLVESKLYMLTFGLKSLGYQNQPHFTNKLVCCQKDRRTPYKMKKK